MWAKQSDLIKCSFSNEQLKIAQEEKIDLNAPKVKQINGISIIDNYMLNVFYGNLEKLYDHYLLSESKGILDALELSTKQFIEEKKSKKSFEFESFGLFDFKSFDDNDVVEDFLKFFPKKFFDNSCNKYLVAFDVIDLKKCPDFNFEKNGTYFTDKRVNNFEPLIKQKNIDKLVSFTLIKVNNQNSKPNL